jgi:hypothetical protein
MVIEIRHFMDRTLLFRLAAAFTLVLVLAPPLAQSKVPDKYKGWHILQRNRYVGRVDLGMCPVGCTFATSIFNGFVRDDGKKITVTLLNSESKTYREFTYERFKARMAKIYRPLKAQPENWKRKMKQKGPGEKMFGLDTIRYDYDLVNTLPPYQHFPDTAWLCPTLRSSPRVMEWFSNLVRSPQEFKDLGLPLKIVETMNTQTHATMNFHETLKIEPSVFADTDFKPPPGYKPTETDVDLFVFGE